MQMLYETPNDFRIVIISHIWLEWSFENNEYRYNKLTKELVDTIDIFNSNIDESKGRQVVLILGGHIHNDFIKFTKSRVPIILCDSDSKEKSWLVTNSISSILLSQSISVVNIDNDSEIINIIRVGRGNNKKISFKKEC